ncbi:MAG: hypothetical protein COW00_10130 [Bdellovibrio sp. CG12_big_fil_rev_8_21_14_0_65_39_13]|nr:MAG: hypothetical protein COW78_01185 [Bdellovibrio sp. CG22_combo_CG10-13_8_21_14_all_39_27]PIQ59469.1 MAG: hypothetical protein COW00_10130 [Bdellovibrio sp. CG12_big_fil_rev_8_21_14_0_65_39_13]PIR36599.1 MAG: hypothetical protein COV37_02860 [Bdellovibrio sp. CG11_big_fil_rev_8_21_14_0_20_39_38]PJB53922.1 MAG: hypothetical protein CO099_04350 [Bdellovibrio sp. CG_4_9_14_3_um_filter_39_7]
MKFHSLGVLFLVSAKVYSFECDRSLPSAMSKNLDSLTDNSFEVSCAEFEARNKCVVKEERGISNLDPEWLAKKLIFKDKAKADDKKDRYGSLIEQLFNTASSQDSSLNKEEFESQMKARLVDFVKVRQCEPSFGRSQYTLDFDEIGGAVKYSHIKDLQKSKAEASKLLSDDVFKKKASLKIKEHNQENFYRFFNESKFENDQKMIITSYCTPNLSLSAPAPTSYPIPTCKSSISKYFVDNKAELKGQLSSDLEKDQNELKKCIRENEQAGYKVSKVKIKSSANQLRNTSSLEDIKKGVGFCGYDFLGLATARAQFAKNKILPQLINFEGASVELEPQGQNGNGSSGPCPYDKQGNILKEYLGAGKIKLDEFKATDIEVEFEATQRIKGQTESQVNGVTRVRASCSSIRIKCMGDL